MPPGGTLTPDVRRLLVAHALSAVALGLAWPALLVAVWDQTQSDGWLGLAAAARMAPYVLFSWLAGRCADRYPRRLMVSGSLVARLILLVGVGVLLGTGQVGLAVVCASLAVAAGTPAYPALAAEMPALAGDANDKATGLLVTCEVAAFFVGPAVGGALLGFGTGLGACWVAVGCTAAALFLVRRATWIRVVPGPAPAAAPSERHVSVIALLRRDRPAFHAMVVLVANNAVGGAAAIALLPLAERVWESGGGAFGAATAAIGLGALAVPLLLQRAGLSGRAGRRCALVMSAALVVVACCGGVGWALVPLAVAGACTVYVEAVATGVLQDRAPDEARSSVLGLADSVMVAAAGIASAAAPVLAGALGARALLAGCALVSLSMLLLLPSGRTPPPAPSAVAARGVEPKRVPTQRRPADSAVGAAD